MFTGLIREVFHELGMSVTIASASTIDPWGTPRQAGTEARGLLVAAAKRWSVPAARLVTAESVVTDETIKADAPGRSRAGGVDGAPPLGVGGGTRRKYGQPFASVQAPSRHSMNRVNRDDVFLDRWAPVQTELFVAGLELSACRGCRATAVWLGGRMVHPQPST